MTSPFHAADRVGRTLDPGYRPSLGMGRWMQQQLPVSPPPGATLWAQSDSITIGGFSFEAEIKERSEQETVLCFGLSEGPGLVEVEGVASSIVGPDVVRFHKPGDQICSRPRSTRHVGSWVIVTGDFCDGALGAAFDSPFLRPPLLVLARLRRLFVSARSAAADGLWADEAVVAMLESLVSTRTPASRPGRLRDREALLARDAEALLSESYSEQSSLSSIARTLDVSASYLARTFRSATGSTLHEKRERLRLAEAVRRLADGERDISALALDLGYSSHSHFSAAFRKHAGRAPSRVRDAMTDAPGSKMR